MIGGPANGETSMLGYEPAQPSYLSKPQVQKLAESIAAQLGYEPGSDVTELVERLGGSVQVEDTLLQDPERAGSLFVDSADSFRIIIPCHTSPERDKFTIAHELGHYVLHYLWKKKKDENFPDRVFALRKGSDRIEWEANWFAAALLMPRDKFVALFEENGHDIWSTAERFGLSTKAVEIRAKDLGVGA